MSWSDVPQVLFELLWPFVFVFSFVVLVKASIRRFRSKRNIEFRQPGWLFVVSALLSLGVFLFLGAFAMEPLTTDLFLSEKLNKEESHLFFMTGMVIFLVIIPMLITPVVCRLWPTGFSGNQGNKV